MSETLTNMTERTSIILQMLGQQSKVEVSELCETFGVSEVTIRKDLQSLSDRNLLTRVRGGAIVKTNVTPIEDALISNIQIKKMHNQAEKSAIGKLAATLIAENDTIFIDSGTTTLELVKYLDGFNNLTIITNAVNVALELTTRYKTFNIILVGGQIRSDSLSLVGPVAASTLKQFYCDILFLGVDSFSIEKGLSTTNLEEANINQVMISMAKKTVALFDSSKFNKRSFAFIAPTSSIEAIVTDNKIPADIQRHLIDMNIELFVVSPDKV